MTDAKLDGLALMGEARERAANRGAPPPRHPRTGGTPSAERAGQVPPIAPAAPEPAVTEAPPRQAAMPPPAPKPAASTPKRQSPRRERPTKTETPALAGLRPAQFYVDDAGDHYLRSIRAESLMRNSDVSGSAVVRFALQRLRAEMTPSQIVDRLAEPASDSGGAGRKRH